MSTRCPLDPTSIAASIAPIIDRVRLAAAQRTKQLSKAAELNATLRLTDPAFGLFMMIRNTFPDRSVSTQQLGAAFRYQRRGTAGRLIAELHGSGLLEPTTETSLQLSESGRELMRRIHIVGAQAVTELWGSGATSAASLLPLVDRALTAAAPSGGDGFALMTPAYDAPGATAAVQLSERLAGLRFHRFDAHIAAWTAAGLTAETMRELAAGPEREAIEQETNRRAAAPYASLEPGERLKLLAGLGALSG